MTTLNLSLPGNPRYQPRQLQPIFGYDMLYHPVAEVEIATMQTLAEIGIIPEADIAHLTDPVVLDLLGIRTTEVDEVEQKVTKHDIRAWVRIAQEKVHPSLRRWIHVLLTSFDPLDTARSLQFLRAHEQVVRPLTDTLILCLSEQVGKYAETLQVGRTHGQHALPITVGFWLATILNRILDNIKSANIAASNLVGKISGAVGAYNAQFGLGISARCGHETFEERVLKKLGLKPAFISTQILPPEPLANYLFSIVKLSAALAQLGRDCRHLMRTEIGELCEPFEQGQVGSSTMAGKRNPITFENSEGMYISNQAEFTKVLATMISEHQRDLVGSSVARNFPIMVVNLVTQLNALLRKGGTEERPFISRIAVDERACMRNLAMQGDVILAEPLYIALQMAGFEGDAHELVNHQAMPLAKETGMPLQAATRSVVTQMDGGIEVWNRIPEEVQLLLVEPQKYTGIAASRARRVMMEAEIYLGI